MASGDPFKNAEEEYFRLKGQLAAGRITRAQYEEAEKQLMFQDAQGRYWSFGGDTGKWYIHDGQNWIETSPPTPGRPAPTGMPERGAPILPPAPRKRSNAPLLILLAVIVVGLLAVAAFVLAINRGGTNIALNAPATRASSTPTPSTALLPSAQGTSISALETESAQPLAPQAFSDTGDALAAAIAKLNGSELEFIKTPKRPSPTRQKWVPICKPPRRMQ